MANEKLTDLTELTDPESLDWLYVVDVSNTTDNAAGSSRKCRLGGLFNHAVRAYQIVRCGYATGTYETSSNPIVDVPADGAVLRVWVDVTTAFNAASSLIAGIPSDTDKYLESDDVDLMTVGTYPVVPGLAPEGSAVTVSFALTAGSSTQGAFRIFIEYAEAALPIA